jgi:hypothetical protein
MTIDERIEALTQTVELMAHMHRDLDERHSALSHSVELLTAENRETGQKIRALATVAQQCLDSIQSLERIATAH